jgi:hypothetical protein
VKVFRVVLFGFASLFAACSSASESSPAASHVVPAAAAASAPHIIQSYTHVHNNTGTDAWVTIYTGDPFGWDNVNRGVVEKGKTKIFMAVLEDNELKVRIELQPPNHPFVDRTLVNKDLHVPVVNVCLSAGYSFAWC